MDRKGKMKDGAFAFLAGVTDHAAMSRHDLLRDKKSKPQSVGFICYKRIENFDVYEHFGGKEGLYAVVVDREVTQLLGMMRAALVADSSRVLLEQAALSLLEYVEARPEGFRILVRDSPAGSASYQSIIGDVATRVEGILVDTFERRELDPRTAPMYAQMLVGMVGSLGQWWLDSRRPEREVVAAHLVNLAWHGLSGLEAEPRLVTLED
jgi:AcrR family transcriptional regulator